MKLNKKKIEFIVRKRGKGMSTYQISREMNVSERRVNQILYLYKTTGRMPVVGKKSGRPRKEISPEERKIVLCAYEIYKLSASPLNFMIKNKYKVKINHHKIHRILLENRLAKPIGMKIRKKPWVRYERKHSLSAVHMDWAYDSDTGMWIVAVLDDASRMILAYGEFESPTVESTIAVLKKALQYGKIREVITDHGSQFTANKKDKNGNSKSVFAEFCRQNGIKQILCRIKHPQSNGKIERWFGLYRQKKKHFNNLQELVYWYNNIKPHMSLSWEKLETPVQAFRRKFKK